MTRFGRVDSAVTSGSRRWDLLHSILRKFDAKETARFCLVKVWKLQVGTSEIFN